ncbi:hypothetical protein HYW21_00930 [Candidatus Woesearchaeota archaeon]|nr:hypothetical protein [Candidatus Woesearchaeota archaeon]
MRLIKQYGRKYGETDYYKYLVVIPNKLIKLPNLEGGEYLAPEIKGNRLVIMRY